jgi:limonene-1,2-epoxide hydrolase
MASVQVRDGRIAQWRDYFDIAFLKRNVDVTEG